MHQINLAQIGAVNPEVAVVLAVYALEEPSDGRFPRTAAADEAEHRPCWNLERDSVEGRRLRSRIGEAEVLECDCPFEFRPKARAHRCRLRGVVEYLRHLMHGHSSLFDVLHELGEADEWARYSRAEQHEGDESPGGDSSGPSGRRDNDVSADEQNAAVD